MLGLAFVAGSVLVLIDGCVDDFASGWFLHLVSQSLQEPSNEVEEVGWLADTYGKT